MFAHEAYDALIVGARCAGAATAMLMAQKGMRVLAHRSRRLWHRHHLYPCIDARWRASAAPLGRPATAARGGYAAGVRDDIPLRRRGVTVAIKPSSGVGALYAPRRTLLDSTLVDVAREAGAIVRHGLTVVGLTHRSDGRVCGVSVLDAEGNMTRIEADLVVGADGASSSVARLTGAETVHQARHTTAVIFGYFRGIGLTDYHWWYRSGIGAGAIPTNNGRHCVFAAVSPQRLRNGQLHQDRAALFSEALCEAEPALAGLIAGAELDAPLCVFAGRKGFLRQAYGPGWALVGDAGTSRIH